MMMLKDFGVSVSFENDLSGDTGSWRVKEYELHEALSRPYLCRVVLYQEMRDREPDFTAFVGDNCRVMLERINTELERRVCGIAHKVMRRGRIEQHYLVELEIVPALFALGMQNNGRIFQNKTAPDILKEVLNPALSAYGGRSVEYKLKRSDFQTREYCVQYRETDLEFAERLMAEEGIYYFFDHSGDTEKLVLCDDVTNCSPITLAEGSVQVTSALPGKETLTGFTHTAANKTTSVVVHAYDWTQPAVNFQSEKREKDERKRDREWYEAEAPVLTAQYGGSAYGKNYASTAARLTQEAHKAQTSVCTGKGNVIGVCVGQTVSVSGNTLAELDDEYLITAVSQAIVVADGQNAGESEFSDDFASSFEGLPKTVPFRPKPVHNRPKMDGPQTALVTGPSGEEVHTDSHGRIKVRFFWDRKGPQDQESSCWVRVAQSWAGPGFGTCYIPRIGMEVVVHFLNGDPDQPLVTGCVYNGQSPLAHALPKQKTKSYIHTRSSLGGGGFNELSFEDAKGQELIYVHAQKNQTEDVGNDETITIGHDQTCTIKNDKTLTVKNNRAATISVDDTLSVGNNRTFDIGANEAKTVGADRTLDVAANETTTIGADRTTDVGANDSLTVGADQTISIGANQTVDIGANETKTVGSSQSVTVSVNAQESVGAAKNVTVGAALSMEAGATVQLAAGASMGLNAGSGMSQSAGGAFSISAGKDYSVSASGAGSLKITKALAISAKEITAEAKDKIVLKCGDAELSLKKNGDVTLKGKNLNFKLSGKFNVKASGDVIMKGSKIGHN